MSKFKKMTQEQQEAIDQVTIILDNVGLELIGTRPKDRK
tara:strand:- start:421 stop:537 length:117 start_codon:yes stop_codon:yes gene_type:complete